MTISSSPQSLSEYTRNNIQYMEKRFKTSIFSRKDLKINKKESNKKERQSDSYNVIPITETNKENEKIRLSLPIVKTKETIRRKMDLKGRKMDIKGKVIESTNKVLMDAPQGNSTRSKRSLSALRRLDVVFARIVQSDTNSFVVYQIVANSEERFEAYRRYSQFRDLHNKLSCRHKLPPLPAKKYIGNMTQRFIDSRRRALQEYLNKLIETEVAQDKEFLTFLGINYESAEEALKMTTFQWATIEVSNSCVHQLSSPIA